MESLVGKAYPVTSVETNKVVAYRIITQQIELENTAGVVVHLDNRTESGILVSYINQLEIIMNSESLMKNRPSMQQYLIIKQEEFENGKTKCN